MGRTDEWIAISGYRWPYRINRKGCVQKQLEDGSWYTLKPYIGGGRSRAMVKMPSKDNAKSRCRWSGSWPTLLWAVQRPGYGIVHRNGAKLDCALENLKFMPLRECGRLSCRSRRRAVEKIDRNGQIVAIYASAREAARKNFISQNSIWARCNGRVKDPFCLDDHDYRYDKGDRRMKIKLKPLNRGDRKGHHSDDLTDAVP